VSFTESDLVQLVCWLAGFVIDDDKSVLTTISPAVKARLSYLAGLKTDDAAIKRGIAFALRQEIDGIDEYLLQPTAKLAEEYREFRQQIGGDRNG